MTEFTRPSEIVSWLGAVQAQDYLGALWAVGLRLVGASEPDVERALAERSIVRTWPLRGTLHFVAASDARWMLELLGQRVVARAAGRFRALGLDEATFARARGVLVKGLEGGRRVTRPVAYEMLERAKISVAGQRGIHILWRLAHEIVLCFGPREGKQHTFVLADEWLPPTRRVARDEALSRLACRYFQGHGPATVQDFAWWSGLAIAEARNAVHLAGGRLDEESIGGKRYWLVGAAALSAASRPRAHLLPAFDEFLVGFADRSAVLGGHHATRVNAGGGILNPTIVVDGQIVGTWKRRFVRGEVIFSPTLLDASDGTDVKSIAIAFRRYAAFLGVRPRGL